MRKQIIITSIIIAVLALGVGVYFAWQKSKQASVPIPETKGQLPVIGESQFPETVQGQAGPATAQPSATGQLKLRVISGQPVFDYWLATPATSTLPAEIFYFNEAGQILKANPPAGEAARRNGDEVIVQETIENLQQVKSRRDGGMVLVKFGNPAAPQFRIFDVGKKTWQQLDGITAADFSPDNSKIAYLGVNGDLMIKDLVGAKPKITKIIAINQKDFDIFWTTADKIVLTPKPSYLTEGHIWSVDIKAKTLDFLASEHGLMIGWANDGRLGIKFAVSDSGRDSHSTLIDAKGVDKANFDFLALPDKCFFPKPKIYCAVPRFHNAIRDPLLPDDYLKRAVYYKDFIYQIDVDANSFEPLYDSVEPAIDARRLNLNGNELFFINRYDNKIYSLDL